jgi:hypothetical protein
MMMIVVFGYILPLIVTLACLNYYTFVYKKEIITITQYACVTVAALAPVLNLMAAIIGTGFIVEETTLFDGIKKVLSKPINRD